MIRAVVALSLLCAIAAPAFALSYSFRNVADSDGPYTSFGDAPVLNEDGDVAFVALLDSGVQGIFSGPDPGTDTIADDEGPYGSPLDRPSINRDGTVAFRAYLDPTPEDILGGRGIFTGPNPEMDTVADDNGVFFGDFDSPSIANDGTVAFAAISVGGRFGIYKGNDPATDTVADSTGPYKDPLLAADINNRGTVAFFAELDAGGGGMFTGDDPLNDTVADTNGPYKAFDGFFGPAINDEGTVVFIATLDAGGSGIFSGDDPLTDEIVDDSGPYSGFVAYSINDAGTVLFSADLDDGGFGLFTGPDPVAHKVIAEGDPLFGSTVAFVSLFTENLNDNGEVAFAYQLADGLRGVAVASPESLARPIGATKPYEGVRLVSAAGHDTVARLRHGTAGDDRTVSLSFSPGSGFQIGGATPVGDVLDLAGTGADTYVLELTYSDADLAAAGVTQESSLVLLWRDPGDQTWKNAVLGNVPPGGPRFPGLGFDAYRSGIGSTPQLGAHGNDPDGNTVWAVLNHQSLFALAAPEPSSALAHAAAAAVLLLLCRSRNRSRRRLD